MHYIITIILCATNLLGAATQSSSSAAINMSGCVLQLTCPDYVCAGSTFNVTYLITSDDGSSHDIDVTVTISGPGEPTISPKKLTKCPDEGTLIATAGSPTDADGNGKLTITAGGASCETTVLTGTAGQWSLIHDPKPGDPGDLGGPYKNVSLGYNVPGHGWTKDIKEGTLYTVFGIEQGTPQLGPTDCGGSVTKQVSVSGGVGTSIKALGFNFTASVNASLQVTKQIGPESNKRFKAVPIWPKVDIFDNRAWYRQHEQTFFGQVRITTSKWDSTQNNPAGKNYLDGVDFELWGACCE